MGQTSSSSKQRGILLSIVIPSYNRPDSLRNCLQSIVDLTGLDGTVETIVVNDGSAVAYEDSVQPYRSKLNLIYLEQSNAGPASARNHGARHAAGGFLVFLDDDCTLPSAWLQEVKCTIDPDAVFGGHTVNRLEDNVYSQASQVLIDYLYAYYNHDHDHGVFLTSNNLIIPKHIYDTLGGFDLAFSDAAAEDRDLCDRLLHHGYPIKYRPNIVVHHYHGLHLKGYFQQHFRYGYSALLYHQKRMQRDMERPSIEPLRFYRNLLLFPYRTKSPRAFTISMLTLISQMANALGFWKAKYSVSAAR